MPSYQPVLKNFPAWEIKQILQLKPRMVCILDHAGTLRIFNATNIEEVLNASETFKEVDG